MARRRFQTGTLSKLGKRRKVWVIRWTEDVLRDDGTVGRVRRAETIGTVADLPNRRDALAKMEERLREVNQGAQRPESGISFGAFVETQWKVLALPNFKASTQHGYNTVLRVHVLPAGGRGGSATSNGWRFRAGCRINSGAEKAGRLFETHGRCYRAFSSRRSSTGIWR